MVPQFYGMESLEKYSYMFCKILLKHQVNIEVKDVKTQAVILYRRLNMHKPQYLEL